MDNPHHCKTTALCNTSIMEGLRSVTMLPEQIMNWCMGSLERANENLRTLLTTKQPVKAPCRDSATITDPLNFPSTSPTTAKDGKAAAPRTKTERKFADIEDSKTKSFSLPTYANFVKSTRSRTPNSKNDDKLFATYLDKLRKILYVDDDHMLCQEQTEENSIKRFFQRIDNWELQSSMFVPNFDAQPKPKSSRVEPTILHDMNRSNNVCWNRRQSGGGVDGKQCRCGVSCQSKKRDRTFIEYDWTNYDWCATLREALRSRTKQLNRLKRELKLRTVRVLPNVNCF